VKAVITRSGKTSAEPRTKPKRAAPINPIEKKDEAEAKPRLEKEGVDLGKASPKNVSDMHILPFPNI
jgi:hypothetical protein